MLTPDEQAAMADVLRARETDVRAQLHANLHSSEPPSLDEEIGRLTRMDALQQQQMALHARRRLEVQLQQIRGALARADEGSLGQCAMCQHDIASARLEMAPESPFCVSCQGRLEQEGRR